MNTISVWPALLGHFNRDRRYFELRQTLNGSVYLMKVNSGSIKMTFLPLILLMTPFFLGRTDGWSRDGENKVSEVDFLNSLRKGIDLLIRLESVVKNCG